MVFETEKERSQRIKDLKVLDDVNYEDIKDNDFFPSKIGIGVTIKTIKKPLDQWFEKLEEYLNEWSKKSRKKGMIIHSIDKKDEQTFNIDFDLTDIIEPTNEVADNICKAIEQHITSEIENNEL